MPTHAWLLKVFVGVVSLTVVGLLAAQVRFVIQTDSEAKIQYEMWRSRTPRYLKGPAVLKSSNVTHWKATEFAECEWKNAEESVPLCADLLRLTPEGVQSLNGSEGLYICNNGTVCKSVQKVNCSIVYQKEISRASCISPGQAYRERFRAVIQEPYKFTCATRDGLPKANVPNCDGGKRSCRMTYASYEYGCAYPCVESYVRRQCWIQYGTVWQLTQSIAVDYQLAAQQALEKLTATNLSDGNWIRNMPSLPYPFATHYFQELISLLLIDGPTQVIPMQRVLQCRINDTRCILRVREKSHVMLDQPAEYWFDSRPPHHIVDPSSVQEFAVEPYLPETGEIVAWICALAAACVGVLCSFAYILCQGKLKCLCCERANLPEQPPAHSWRPCRPCRCHPRPLCKIKTWNPPRRVADRPTFGAVPSISPQMADGQALGALQYISPQHPQVLHNVSLF